MSSAGGETQLAVNESDWRRIEKAYGFTLSTKVRRKITEATNEFLYFEIFERTAAPSAHSKAVIDACKKGARQFQKTLPSNAFKSTDAGIYASHLIRRNFEDARLSSEDLFHSLFGILTSLDVACTSALRDLQKGASFHEGVSWGGWVMRLSKVMEEEGLPWGVRKDIGGKSKTDHPSPFVLLLHELQECLPQECRRSMHSKTALAEAISEARTSGLKSAARPIE